MNAYFIVLVPVLMALVKYATGHLAEDDAQIEIVRNCQINTECAESFEIIVAATINGAVTALDGETGQLLWRHQDAPLIDGTLSTAGPIDIGGTSLQLMPTLDGRLFSYSQQINIIEPLPITTDSLLESTIRLGQDAVAGGKSVTTKGFDLFTGELKYQCSIDACTNDNEEIPENPVLLVKRISNSIRAMDTIRGVERWNLSTAEIDVSLAGGVPAEKIPSTSGLRVLLQPPDGVVVAVNEYNREQWKTEVDGHIVSVWKISGNRISEISLFDPSNIYTTQFEVMHRTERNMQTQTSLLYMGTSEGYPFIIQSPKAKRNLKRQMNALNEMSQITELTNPKSCSASNGVAYQVEDTALRVVLRDAFKQSRSKAIEDKSSNVASSRGNLQIVAPHESAQTIGTENLRSTSLSKGGDYGYLVLETEKRPSHMPSPISLVHTVFNYVFSPAAVASFVCGFFGMAVTVIYNQIRKRHHQIMDIDSRSRTESENSSLVTQSMALVQDMDKLESSEIRLSSRAEESCPPTPSSEKSVATRSSPNARVVPRYNQSEESSVDEEHKMQILRSRTISKSSLEGFTSRFAEEFAVKKVIGHGGFGVVFKAQSITDRNEYAVKRIAVADNDKARNRVLREARALAMFDHPAIIRYFYAWEERPPKGFQEKEDENLLGKIKAEKLSKLHKKAKKQSENVKSDTTSFAGSFEMPPVVGNTANSSWSDVKPEEIGGKKRTTSESKRGLHGDSDTTAEISREKSVRFSDDFSNDDLEATDESSSSSSDESSSSSDASAQPYRAQSSSGGIVFENESADDKLDEKSKKQTSIHNEMMIVETENQELDVRIKESGECAYLYIVMQLCAEKTLEHWIRRNKSLESRCLPTMKSWIKQLASGLEYLHNKGFIHRDLKPGNVFFSLDSNPDHHILKIGDLGLATKTDGAPQITGRQDSNSDARHTKNVGTRSYMSPEQLGHQEYTSKVDIFALGLMATEMIVPFGTVMERIQTFADFQKGATPAILDNYPESRDFLLQLTSLNPAQRPTAQKVAHHQFLN